MDSNMLRSILCVVLGYLAQFVGVMIFFVVVMAILGAQDPKTFQPPAWLLAAELVVAPLAAAAGGYVCAWIARVRPMRHVYILMALMAVLAVVSIIGEQGLKPLWSVVAVPVLGLAGTYAGARLRLATPASVKLPAPTGA